MPVVHVKFPFFFNNYGLIFLAWGAVSVFVSFGLAFVHLFRLDVFAFALELLPLCHGGAMFPMVLVTASMTNNRRTYKRKRPIRDTVRATPDCKGYSLLAKFDWLRANHYRDVTVTVVGWASHYHATAHKNSWQEINCLQNSVLQKIISCQHAPNILHADGIFGHGRRK